MAQVGLKETLALLAAGYKKKDIEALASIDEQEAEKQEAEKQEEKEPEPVKDEKQEKEEKEPEPDYKTMYEELLKKNQEAEAKVTKLQQDNIHENSAPAAEEAMAKQAESLTSLVRSFM